MATKKTVTKGKTVPLSRAVSKELASKIEKRGIRAVKLVSFTVGAVIPTQAYGNIQPSITVESNSIEEARAVVMPVIESMIEKYAETRPGFLGKVEVTEKVVTQTKSSESSSASSVPVREAAPASSESKVHTEVGPTGETMTVTKPEAVLKAEKALSLSATVEAVKIIENQIINSVKIPPQFKEDLYKLCFSRAKELAK